MVKNVAEYKKSQNNSHLTPLHKNVINRIQMTSSRNPHIDKKFKLNTNSLLKGISEKNLLSYVRRVRDKMQEGTIDNSKFATVSTSRGIANNIVRMREKFSILDKNTEGPTRKIIILDDNMRFNFKRRSMDFVTTKQLKSKMTNGKTFKIHDTNIVEIDHNDYVIRGPAPKEDINYKLDPEKYKIPHHPHMELLNLMQLKQKEASKKLTNKATK